jgi:hypothetical protein
MTNIEAMTKLDFVIEKLTQAEEFGLAKELSEIQIQLIDERSKEWNKGYDAGRGLALREIELRRLKVK